MLPDKFKKFIIFLLISFPGIVFADDDFFDEEGMEESLKQFEMFCDIQLRGDVVRNLPRPLDSDFERAATRARLGFFWNPVERIEFGFAGKVNVSSQSNSETRFNLDNERADAISIDELFISFDLQRNTKLLIGQTHFPLQLSPMLWDQDLRPQGVSLTHKIELGDFDSLELNAGTFFGNHLYGDDSRIHAAQLAYHFGKGKQVSYELKLAYLDFNDLDRLSANGLGRTNLISGGTFVNDFTIVDVQFGVNFNLYNIPVEFQIDLLKNVAASDDNFAGRVDLIFGNSIRQQGFEVGFAAQRIQREALVAAFNDDDWWFPTRMRGATGWLAYGFNESLRVKLGLFTERLDVVPDYYQRALFDLQYFY